MGYECPDAFYQQANNFQTYITSLISQLELFKMLSINMKRSSKKTISTIVVNFEEESVVFSGKASVRLEKVIRDKNDVESNLFDCLNEYISGVMPLAKQKSLFNLYKRAHSIVENGNFRNYNEELLDLKPIVDSVFRAIDIDKYTYFIRYSKHLQIPKDLEEAASKGDYPVETTITDKDYVGLATLAFVIRVIYPIIFGLNSRFATTMGTEASELISGDLIKDNKKITSLEGWEKLETYVNYAFSKRGLPAQVDSVVSMENFVDKVLYNAIFSRLCCAVIPETEEKKNLATAINATVRQHESGRTIFRPKDRTVNDNDDKRSIFDKYQIQESVKSSDQVMQAEFFSFGLFNEKEEERFKDRFKHQCIALGIENETLVEMVYDKLPTNWNFLLNDHIHKLLQLVYFGEVSPFIFEACDYTQLMSAIALAQVRLSEKGFNYLPSLLGAIEDPNGTRQLADALKLNTEDKEYLASICDVQSKNSEGRSFNEALVSATEFLDTFGNGKWHSNLEYGVLATPEVYKRVKTAALFEIEIDGLIKDEFLNLIRLIND